MPPGDKKHPSNGEISDADARTVLLVQGVVNEAIKPVALDVREIKEQMAGGAGTFRVHDHRISALEKKAEHYHGNDTTREERKEHKEPSTDKSSKRGMVSEATLLRIITIISGLAMLAMGAKMALGHS